MYKNPNKTIFVFILVTTHTNL